MIKRIEFDGSKFALRRIGDNAGDSGYITAITYLTAGDTKYTDGVLSVGSSCRVGSLSGRMFSAQDYWTTTSVTSIDSVDTQTGVVEFTTRNSRYRLEAF